MGVDMRARKQDKREKNRKKQMDGRERIAVLTAITLLGACGFILTAFLPSFFTGSFFMRYRVYITVAVAAALLTGVTLAYSLFFAGNKTGYRMSLSAIFLLDFSLAIFCLLSATGFLEAANDPESFRAYLLSAGAWMDVLFIVLQFLQVVVLPLPSFVTLLAGTALFGAVKCFLYSYFSIVAGSVVAFLIGRFLGVRAVKWMVGEDTLEKWMNKMRGKDNLLLTAMFILPLFPDDVLCFVAGLSSMTLLYFVGMTLVARGIAVAGTCFLAGALPFTTWWGILAWVGVWVTEFALFLLFRKNQDRLQHWLHRRRTKNKGTKSSAS